MSQTIGTNVVVDGQEQYQLLKSLLDFLENLMNRRHEEEYARNLKVLASHVQGGGQLSYSLVKGKYAAEIERRLKQEQIPYFPMPDESGNVAFMVKDTDKERVFQIEQSIFALSTDYWKEIQTNEMINIIQNDRSLRREKIPVLTFQDEDMRSIASQRLYNNHIVSAYNGEVTVVHPSSLFGRSGDLVDVELDMAFETAKRDGVRFEGKSVDMLTVRKQQAQYDKNQIFRFVEAYQNREKGAILWNLDNQSSTGLKIDREGNIVLMEKQQGGQFVDTKIVAPAESDLSRTALFGLLSAYTQQMRNIVKADSSQAEDILQGRGRELVKAGTLKARPRYEKTETVDYAAAEKLFHGSRDFDRILDQLKREATQAVMEQSNYESMSQTERAQAKRDYIADRLEDENVTGLTEWLTETSSGYTKEDKRVFLETIKNHFVNTHERTTEEMTVDMVSAKEIADEVLHEFDQTKIEEKETIEAMEERESNE